MRKIKNFLWQLLITVVFWAIARGIPSYVGILLPDIVILKMIAMIAMLPLGWLAASRISRGRYPGCINVNTYIFAIIEFFGLFKLAASLYSSLRFYTGQFTLDPYGIPYSDYPMVYGGTIVVEILYIALCYYLITKKSHSPSAPEKDLSDRKPIPEPVSLSVSSGSALSHAEETPSVTSIAEPEAETPEAIGRQYSGSKQIPRRIPWLTVVPWVLCVILLAATGYLSYMNSTLQADVVANWDAGYTIGYEKGSSNGYSIGYSACRNDIKNMGYSKFRTEFKAHMKQSYSEGYLDGYKDHKNGEHNIDNLTDEAILDLLLLILNG